MSAVAQLLTDSAAWKTNYCGLYIGQYFTQTSQKEWSVPDQRSTCLCCTGLCSQVDWMKLPKTVLMNSYHPVLLCAV